MYTIHVWKHHQKEHLHMISRMHTLFSINQMLLARDVDSSRPTAKISVHNPFLSFPLFESTIIGTYELVTFRAPVSINRDYDSSWPFILAMPRLECSSWIFAKAWPISLLGCMIIPSNYIPIRLVLHTLILKFITFVASYEQHVKLCTECWNNHSWISLCSRVPMNVCSEIHNNKFK